MLTVHVDVWHVVIAGSLRWTERRERRTRRTRQTSEFSLLVYLEAPRGPRCCNTPMKSFHGPVLTTSMTSKLIEVHRLLWLKKFSFTSIFFLSAGKTRQRWWPWFSRISCKFCQGPYHVVRKFQSKIKFHLIFQTSLSPGTQGRSRPSWPSRQRWRKSMLSYYF